MLLISGSIIKMYCLKYSVTAVTTRPQFIGEAGIFYQFNEEDYFSINANLRSQNERFPIYTDSYLSAPGRARKSTDEQL